MDKKYCDNLCRVLNLKSYEADYWNTDFGLWPVYPYCVEDAVRQSKVCFEEQNCRYVLINVVLDGELLYYDSAGREYYVDTGKIFVVPMNNRYSFATTGKRYYRKLVLEISGDMLPHLQERLGLHDPTLLAAGSENLINNILKVKSFMRCGGLEDVPKMIGLVWEVLTSVSDAGSHKDFSHMLASRAKAWLEKNLSSNYSIKMLASELGMCHSLLDRFFRSETGMSPQQYRMNYRYTQARYYLANTSYSIKEISARLGFSNQLYFSNDFRKRSGVSPTGFRESSSRLNQPPTG